MENTFTAFQKRQVAISRKHSRMARGYVNKLDKSSGVIVQEPDGKTGRVGLGILVKLVVVLLALKVLTLAWLGPEVYQGHVDELRDGSAVEQAGSYVMQVDPISERAAAMLGAVLR